LNTAKQLKTNRLTAIDLFAGAGGFSLAAQLCGIEVRAAVEHDFHACATYRANLVDERTNIPVVLEEDINDLKWPALLKKAQLSRGECDLLLGGPPCQGFSTHRIKGAGIGDPRNELLARYFECVKAIRPSAFLIENVSGLLWKRHESYLNQLYDAAKQAKYKVLPPILINARSYGVPQNRKRVFILGFRGDVDAQMEWPPCPTHFPPGAEEVINGASPKWRVAAEVFSRPIKPNDANGCHMQHSKELVVVFRSTPRNGGSRSDSNRVLKCHSKHDGHKDVYGRIDPRQPGPTMTTACINPSKGRFVHPTEDHGICLRHAARFQTFPERFVFKGGLIAGGQQIGNAVPIDLGVVLITEVKKALLAAANGGKQTDKNRGTA